jgi:hypothetical protein
MNQTTTLPRPLTHERAFSGARHGLRAVLGAEAWHRLPEAIRERFAEHAGSATYAGGFEVVRASAVGRLIAWIGTMFGTPVAPRVGSDVEAVVLVRPHGAGMAWSREYRWHDGTTHRVHSTKIVTADGELIEKLPARLCMPLAVFEEGRVLHFVSRGYYFDLGFGCRLRLPHVFSPGVTHVEHIDLDHGWFRFTMTLTHPWFGELFFQTGRFCAMESVP